MLDDKTVVVGETELRTLRIILEHATVQPGDLVTIYQGSGVSLGDAEQMRNSLENEFSDIEIELVYGGQPQYAYLIGIE